MTMTDPRSKCPLFLHVLSFEGTTKQARNYLNKILKGFIFYGLVQDLLFEFCNEVFCILYSYGVKYVPVLCLWFWGVFPIISFSVFTYQ